MKVIKPNAIHIRSTNVPPDNTQAWASSKSYAEGDTVQHANRLYKSLKAANVAKQPDLNDEGIEAWWRDMGATNPWRMFDETIGTQTALSREGDGTRGATFWLFYAIPPNPGPNPNPCLFPRHSRDRHCLKAGIHRPRAQRHRRTDETGAREFAHDYRGSRQGGGSSGGSLGFGGGRAGVGKSGGGIGKQGEGV